VQFIPAIDDLLTVSLPGEILRMPVIRVVDRDTVFCELDGNPLNPSKQHSYRKGDVVAVRRRKGALGETWQAVDDRVLYARQPEETEPPLPPKRKTRAKVKAKPTVVKRKAKGRR
jgi:hypothetical protein